MDTRSAFTDEEWKQVKDLPSFAALLIVSSGGTGPMQMVMESTAAAKAIAGSAGNPDPLVAAVVDGPDAPRRHRQAEAPGGREVARGLPGLC